MRNLTSRNLTLAATDGRDPTHVPLDGPQAANCIQEERPIRRTHRDGPPDHPPRSHDYQSMGRVRPQASAWP